MLRKQTIILSLTLMLSLAAGMFPPCSSGLTLDTQTLHTRSGSFGFDGSLAPDGSMGVAYKNTGSSDLMYKQVQGSDVAAWENITASHPGSYFTPYLVYDSQSSPHVFTSQSSDIIRFYKSGGSWEKEVVFTLDSAAYPDLYNYVGSVAVGKNDAFHVLCSGPFSVFYITNKGGTWSQAPEIVDTIPDSHVDIFGNKMEIRSRPDMAVDGNNAVHAVYSTLYETRYLTNSSGSWAYEDIYSDQNIDYWPAENPSIALDSAGTPAVVGTEMGHTTTGSVTFAKLRYIKRTNGSWNAAEIVSSADNYVGSDGNKFTGINAQLAFDGQDTPHIIFSDHASYHNSNGWNYTKDGQIRYAVQSGGQWSISTLYSQSPDNGEMHKLQLAVTSDGDGVHILGQEVIRVGNPYDQYNDDETYNLLYLGTPYTAPAVPAAPVLSVAVSGTDVTLSWNSVAGATGYTLFFAPYPNGNPVGSADLGNITSTGFKLFSGAAYYLALQAYSGTGSSDVSNVEFFTIP